MKTVPLILCVLAISMLRVTPMATAQTTEIGAPADYRRLKLGLWEESRRSESPAAPAIDPATIDMSHFTPEERARVGAVLKRQQQERVAGGDAPKVSTRTKRSCLTADKLDREWSKTWGDDRSDKNVQCKRKVVQSSASRLAVTGECTVANTGPKAGPYSGGGSFRTEMVFEIKSPESTSASISTVGQMGNVPMKRREVVEARWIGADCGNIK